MATFHLSVKSGKRGRAANHANYIAREGRHGKSDDENDLITTDYGNLPDWANGDPAYFWKMADQNERINGAAYREYEIALPAELTIEQNIELVNKFIQKAIPNKPYQAAVHAPYAALGDVEQPHAHVMFSDRVPDGIDRSPEQHFRRHNPHHPERGGCKKESGGKLPCVLRDELITRRAMWSQLENDFLEKYGHTSRVDHRSNRERGIDKEAERHLGQGFIQKMTMEEKAQYKERREGI